MQPKFKLTSLQWALIGSGCTLVLALASFGLWNIIAPSKTPIPTATTSTNPTDPTEALINEIVKAQIVQGGQQVNKARQSEAKQNIGSMNRAQQAFWLENNHLSSELERLFLGIKSETENYSYSIVSINEKGMVQNVGLAKGDELKSFTGIVYVNKTSSGESITQAILCQSDQPTREFPSKPEVSGSDVKCPPGYSPLR